ncbi:phosphotransferase family protein [Exiguobacterium sp. s166]|uniref:phosphotransferase family protein n=1 Tax=unclassified Exiguobacterium TaxID=2644629 RepID=UPI001BE9DBF9|nr:aminoglycoside phosphotransferase family protein [Exiguobacterium sp. s166]
MSIIGSGNTAMIQKESETIVRKQFHDSIPFAAIQQEFQNHQRIRHNFPMTPQVYDCVNRSIRMEYLSGEPLGDLMQCHPFRIWRYMTKMVISQKLLHALSIAGLPLLQERYPDHDGLVGGTALCHGDFHPYNLLLVKEELYVIDWMDASIGNPLMDVARTFLLIRYGGRMSLRNPAERISRFILSHLYRICYFKRIRKVTGFKGCLRLCAASRLEEQITPVESVLLQRFLK